MLQYFLGASKVIKSTNKTISQCNVTICNLVGMKHIELVGSSVVESIFEYKNKAHHLK